MASLLNYSEFINESSLKEDDSSAMQKFKAFAEKRLAGATKIAESAKEKGGSAMLTYHHFVVKLPYYKKAVAGKFDVKSATSELRLLNKELNQLLKTFEPKDQIPFQKVMGKIEVVGELLIKSSDA